MRSINDPYGITRVLIDKDLGDAYATVKLVAANLDKIGAAPGHADAAASSAALAETISNGMSDIREEAASSAASATASANAAAISESNAFLAQDGAETAQGLAETARNDAAVYLLGSQAARDDSITARIASEAARDTALTYRNETEGFKDEASVSATDAQGSADDAEAKAGAALSSAIDAAGAAIAASASATQASGSAEDAATSETNANTAMSGAQTARTGSETARDTAITAKDDTLAAKNVTLIARDEVLAYASAIDPDLLATKAELATALDALVDAAPGTLDTLNELAAALGDDPNFATTVTTSLAGKAALAHDHIIGNITGLQTALDGKSDIGHTHAYGIVDISGLQTALDGKANTGHGHDYLPLAGGTLTGSVGATEFRPTGTSGGLNSYNGGAITSLVPGTTGGILLRSGTSGHAVVGINGNDTNDSFAVVSCLTSDEAYNRLCFRVDAVGNGIFDGSLSLDPNTVSGAVASPAYLHLGATYSDAAGVTSKGKLKLHGNGYALGVSASQLDYMVSGSSSHVFYQNGAERLRISDRIVFATEAVARADGDSRILLPGKTGTSYPDLQLNYSGGGNVGFYRTDGAGWHFVVDSEKSIVGQNHITAAGYIEAAHDFRCLSGGNILYAKSGTGSVPTAILHVNTQDLYFMVSNASSGGVNGTYNSLRPLFINLSSGMLNSRNGQDFTGTLKTDRIRITATNDGSETSTAHGFQVGPDSGSNIIIDDNEIISRSNGSLSGLNLIASSFYVAGQMRFTDQPIRNGQGGFLHHNSSSRGSGAITVSTGNPSGGSSGDVWFKV